MVNVNYEQDSPVIRELAFLTKHTGHDEATLLARALHIGLEALYQEAMEQAFIDDVVTRAEAIAALGRQRVEEIKYAKQALAQDVARGLDL